MLTKYLFKSPLVHPWKLKFLCQILHNGWMVSGCLVWKLCVFMQWDFWSSWAIVHNQFKVFMKSHIEWIHASFYNFAVLDCILQYWVYFAHKKVDKNTLKVAQKNSNPLFFLTAWSAQTAQTEIVMFPNGAFRPTVYRTGLEIIDSNRWKWH